MWQIRRRRWPWEHDDYSSMYLYAVYIVAYFVSRRMTTQNIRHYNINNISCTNSNTITKSPVPIAADDILFYYVNIFVGCSVFFQPIATKYWYKHFCTHCKIIKYIFLTSYKVFTRLGWCRIFRIFFFFFYNR